MATSIGSVSGGTSSGSSGSIMGQLDVQYIVEQIIYADQEPIRDLQQYETLYNARKAAFQELNTKVSAVESALYAMNTSGFDSKTANLSTDEYFSASASSTASNGNYSIIVKQLATAQSSTSTGFASADSQLLSNGTFTIKNYDGSEVLGTVDFSSGTMSLNQLKNRINSLGLDITATVINFGTSSSPSYRLQLTSDSTGLENGFTLEETDAGGGSLPGMITKVAAQDAQVYVNTDPVANPTEYISRSSNSINDIINGVTLNLKKAVDTPITLSKATTMTVEADTSSLKDKVNAFATAFNDVVEFLNEQFTFDQDTQTAGVLSGESAAVKIKTDLLSMVSSRVQGIDSSESYKTLSTIGITLSREGKLEVDETKLDSALSTNLDAVKRLFKNVGSADNAEITYIGKSDDTVGGRYETIITRAAEQAKAVGADAIDTLGQDENLTITYGGKNYTVNLTSGMTSSQVVEAINSKMDEKELGVFAQVTGGKLEILSDAYGSSQNISVVSNVEADDPDGSTGIGTTTISDTGVDVAGKFKDSSGNVLTASGSGRLLTGTSGGAKGLVVSVATTSVTDTVNGDSKDDVYYTKGITESLRERVYEFTFPYSGILARNISQLDSQLDNISDQIASITARLAIEEEMLITQYTKANEALSQMDSLLSQLSGS